MDNFEDSKGSLCSAGTATASNKTSSDLHLAMPTLDYPRRVSRASTNPFPLPRVESNSELRTEPSEAATVTPLRDRDTSERVDLSSQEVALPKGSPLRQHVQARPRRHLSSEDPQTISSQSRGRRRSSISPEELARAGLHGSQLVLPQSASKYLDDSMNFAGFLRETSEREQVDCEVALPKKSPLRHHVQSRNRRQSLQDQNMSASSSSKSPVRRTVINPEDLARAGLGCSQSPMQDTSMADMDASASLVGSIRQSSSREDTDYQVPLPKRSPLRQHVQAKPKRQLSNDGQRDSSSHSPARRTSKASPLDFARAGLQGSQQIVLDTSIAELDTSIRMAGSIRDTSEREHRDCQVALPKKSPLNHQRMNQVRRQSMQEAGMRNSSSRSPSRRPRQEDHVVADTDPMQSSCIIDSSIRLDDTVSMRMDGSMSARMDGSTMSTNGLRRTSNDDAVSKFGMRISHSSVPRSTSSGTARMPSASVASSTRSFASTSSSIVEADAKVKAGLRNSRMMVSETTPALPVTTACVTGADGTIASTDDADARLKHGLRYSRCNTNQSSGSGTRTPTRCPSDLSAPDSRIKAGLRNSTSVTPGARAVTGSPADQSSNDTRIKAGLRSSTAPGTATPTHSPSDLNTSDARIKAGLRSSNFSGTTTPSRTEEEGSFSLTPPRSDGSARSTNSGGKTSTTGLRRNRDNSNDAGDQAKYGLRVSRTSTNSSTSTTSTEEDLSARPGAYHASVTTTSPPNLRESPEEVVAVERRPSQHKGGMSVLGREGVGGTHHQDSFTSNHGGEASIHFQPLSGESMDTTLPEDLENQSFKDLPLADVEEINESDEDAEKDMRRIRWGCGFLLAMVVLGIVGAVVGVATSSSKPTAVSEEDDDVAVPVPPQPEPNRPQQATSALEQVFGNPKDELPSETVVAIEYGKDSDPQVRAFQWILNDPNLSSYSMPQLKQRMALASFFFATKGPQWFDGSKGEVKNAWIEYDTHECDWFTLASQHGVTVCKTAASGPLPLFEHHEYTALVLTGFFGALEDVATPSLEGGLVPELAMLSSLEILDLGVQKLKGSIPSNLESWMASMNEIVLYDNKLSGTIPPSLYKARKLWLSFNAFDPSVIPGTVGTRLTSLALTATNIGGTIPSQLFELNLKHLYLGQNQVEGSIPSEIGQLHLTTLELQDNQLSSTLPTELGLLTDAAVLRVHGNTLTGTLPSELGRLSGLLELQLSMLNHGTELQGTIPMELFIAAEESRSVDDTMGSEGSLQPAFPKLQKLWLSSAKISGVIPTEVGLMASLTKLRLGWNEMSGTMPSELGLLKHLEDLGLAACTLKSTIPSELGLLPLQELRLQDNELSGNFPTELGPLADSLRVFRVDGNDDLSGTVPDGLCSVEHLALGCLEGGSEVCGCDCPCVSG